MPLWMGLSNQQLWTMGRLFSHFISRESDALLGLQLEWWVVGQFAKTLLMGQFGCLPETSQGHFGPCKNLDKTVTQTPEWLAEVE